MQQKVSKPSNKTLKALSRDDWNSPIERANKSNIIKLETYKHTAKTIGEAPLRQHLGFPMRRILGTVEYPLRQGFQVKEQIAPDR